MCLGPSKKMTYLREDLLPVIGYYHSKTLAGLAPIPQLLCSMISLSNVSREPLILAIKASK